MSQIAQALAEIMGAENLFWTKLEKRENGSCDLFAQELGRHMCNWVQRVISHRIQRRDNWVQEGLWPEGASVGNLAAKSDRVLPILSLTSCVCSTPP